MLIGEKNNRTAISISIIIHSLLIVLFYFIKLNWTYEVTELTEITFVRGEDISKNAPPEIEPEIQRSVPAKQLPQESKEIVTLPLRKMLEEEEPLVTVKDREKEITNDDVISIPDIDDIGHRENLAQTVLADPSLDEKEMALPSEAMSPDEKLLPSSALDAKMGSQTPYEIEGEAAKRIVVYKVIPEYPEDLQKQAIVKIRFTVLPNGQVGDMIPVIKADAQLEKITLEALRQWKFNPLSSGSSQQNETGIITFRYLLR